MSRSQILEPARSETFPYPELYAHGVSPLGPLCYFDTGAQPSAAPSDSAQPSPARSDSAQPSPARSDSAQPSPARSDTGLPPVVLIHPLGTNFTLWEYVAPVLAQHTRVVGLDLPGCGRSAKPRHPYSLHIMTQAVLGLMNHLGLKSAVIFGHSFGGRIAADLALHHRDRVAGLVLMNSSGFNRYSKPTRLIGQALFRPRVVAPLIIRSIDHVFYRIFGQSNERTERFIRQVVERPDPKYAWEFAYYACPMISDLMSDVLDRLHELTLPIQVIWGEKDRLLRYEEVLAWVQRLPDARLLGLPECGHMPSLEQPEAVNAATVQFLYSAVAPGYRRAGGAAAAG